MAESFGEAHDKVLFRVSADRDGQVHLSLDGLDGERVVVGRPVTRETLEAAKTALVKEILRRLAERGEMPVAVAGAPSEPQRQAREEIAAALAPPKPVPLLARVEQWVFAVLVIMPLQALIVLALIAFAYKGIQYSSAMLPRPLHLVVLALYTAVIVVGIIAIATEESRRRWRATIVVWFGPRGLIVLSCLILVTAAAVFASFTFYLYGQDTSLLSLPPGVPAAAAVTEGRLMDFYMWHFLKLVPLLQINDVLKWDEPLHYDSSLVGFLILLFQGAVVIPSIAAMRSYWKTKDAAEKEPLAPLRATFVQD